MFHLQESMRSGLQAASAPPLLMCAGGARRRPHAHSGAAASWPRTFKNGLRASVRSGGPSGGREATLLLVVSHILDGPQSGGTAGGLAEPRPRADADAWLPPPPSPGAPCAQARGPQSRVSAHAVRSPVEGTCECARVTQSFSEVHVIRVILEGRQTKEQNTLKQSKSI